MLSTSRIFGSKCVRKSQRSLGQRSTHQANRSYSTWPLTQDIPGTPKQLGTATPPVLASHTLKNGLQVVTVKTNDPIASVGLFVGTGSRFEMAENAGTTFLLRQLGFKGTKERHALRLVRELELMSANYSVDVGREHILYSAELPCEHTSDFIPILADVIHPELQEWEVKECRKQVIAEAKSALSDARTALIETLHAEAFLNVGLGRGLYSSAYNGKNLQSKVVQDFIESTFSSDRMVLVAIGQVDHQEIVQKASVFESEEAIQFVPEKSEYHGGDARLLDVFDPLFAIGFEGKGFGEQNFLSLQVLKHILGSGRNQRFDTPGSGLSSRFNRNLVEKYPEIKELSTFNFSYSENGIFGVQGCVSSGNIAKIVQAIYDDLRDLPKTMTNEEVEAAKTQLKSEILFATESRNGLMEFLGRQGLQRQKIQTPGDYVKSINNITLDGVKSLGELATRTPTIVFMGDITKTPNVLSQQ